jgi:hypothetical protein
MLRELFRSKSVRSLILIPGALLLVSGCVGCGLERGGLDACSEIDIGLRPRVICPGESVTLSWNVRDARVIPCEQFFDPGFGEGCLGTVDERFSVMLTSDPEPVFGGTQLFTGEGASGSTTITPMSDVRIDFNVFRQHTARVRTHCDLETLEVRVLGPSVTAFEELSFAFGCTAAAGGAPGWGPINIERGEIASSSVSIQRVVNLSAFPIRLTVLRDSPGVSIPPLVTVELAAAGTPGDSTTDIAQEFFGRWSAAPLDPAALGPTGCEGDPAAPGNVTPDPSAPPLGADQPDIVVSVLLGCPSV